MLFKAQVPKKNSVIPGYSGYKPQIGVNNKFVGRTVTEQSREVLKPEIIDQPKNNLSSTGFNHSLIPKKDDSLHATSSRYTGTTMQRNAADFVAEDRSTTTSRAAFTRPQSAPRTTMRERDSSVTFTGAKTLQVNSRLANRRGSGYASNLQMFDGQTWQTEKNLHSDMVRTMYRNNFNQEKGFHKTALLGNDGRLKKRSNVFDASDK